MMIFKLHTLKRLTQYKNRILIFLSILMCTVAINPLKAAEPQALDNIAAVVNSDVILMSELRKNVQQVQAQQKTDLTQQQLTKDVLEKMIMDKLQVQKAKSLGIKIDDAAVDTAMQSIASQNKLDLPQLRTAIIKRGLNYKEFRENIRDRLYADNLRKRQQGSSSNDISDNEIDDLIQSESFNISQDIQYQLIDIVIPNNNSSVQQFNSNLQSAQNLRNKLLKNYNLSNDEITKMGATKKDLGWKNAETLSPIYSRTLSLMDEGELSNVFRDTQGFHILKLVKQQGGKRQQTIEAKVRHILIANKDPNAKLQITKLRNQILAGESFSQLAKEFSYDKGSAVSGGELPVANSSNYVASFAKVVDTIALNTLSEPVQTEFGWHLIEVLERKSSDQTRDAIKNQAKERVGSKKSSDDMNNWLKTLREEAFVEYRIKL